MEESVIRYAGTVLAPVAAARARLYNWKPHGITKVTRKRTHPVEAERILFEPRPQTRAISAGTTSAIMKFLAR